MAKVMDEWYTKGRRKEEPEETSYIQVSTYTVYVMIKKEGEGRSRGTGQEPRRGEEQTAAMTTNREGTKGPKEGGDTP